MSRVDCLDCIQMITREQNDLKTENEKCSKVDYTKFNFAERLYLDILAVNGTFENPVNQITGVTTIFDYKGFNIRSFLAHTPGWTRVFVESFMSGCPSRIKAIHVVNAPSPFSAVFKILFPFLPKKIQDRVFLHPNDNWKSLHSAIPPEVLPEEYGGKLTFDSCINVLENIEEVDDQFRNMFKYGYIKTKADRQSFRPICL
ncbi:Clavesin-2 [Araneus ventricosus]|uniref:Clavesin-2 n=1 Tax=Araneus ventricosus TaxID=182803 RepID=A0A4Y2JER8_ARAVE|nr:Clavesin-2 [Araneus ventricosus]